MHCGALPRALATHCCDGFAAYRSTVRVGCPLRGFLVMPPEQQIQPFGAPGRRWLRWAMLAVVFLVVALISSGALPRLQREERPYPSRTLAPEVEPEPVMMPPPPIDDDYFPCSDCHEDEPADPERRELDEHDNIKLAHGDLWCLDCHQSDQRDLLHLSDASPVEMSESWRLCTRCHAKKIPEWRAGVHGKRVGSWWGPKEYWTCVKCHDPHSPLFKPLTPKPPPVAAEDIQLNRSPERELEDASHEEE